MTAVNKRGTKVLNLKKGGGLKIFFSTNDNVVS